MPAASLRCGKDSGFGRFPSRVFAINQAWLELALTGIDLLAWTQHLLLDGELAHAHAGTLTADHRDALAHDEAAGSMWRLVRATELAGHDPLHILSGVIRTPGSLDTAESIAKVLHYRLTKAFDRAAAPSGDSYTDRTPHADTDIGRWARDLATAMDHRSQILGEQIAATPAPWATDQLGAIPDDPLTRQDWISRTGRVAAYREQYLDPDASDRDAIGPCPPPGAAEVRAAWYAAWRALGQPDDRRPEADMTVPQLRDQIAAYAREEAWAPPWVGEQLRDTTDAGRHYRERAVLLDAVAAGTTDHDRQTNLAADVAAHARIADRLEHSRQKLEHVDNARGQWYLHTADMRARADAAHAELQQRDAQSNKSTAGADNSGMPAGPSLGDQPPQAAQGPITKQPDDPQVSQAEPAAEPQPMPDAPERDDEPADVHWPTGVPTPDQLTDAMQRANEAIQIMAARVHTNAQQHDAAELQHQLDAHHQRSAAQLEGQ